MEGGRVKNNAYYLRPSAFLYFPSNMLFSKKDILIFLRFKRCEQYFLLGMMSDLNISFSNKKSTKQEKSPSPEAIIADI